MKKYLKSIPSSLFGSFLLGALFLLLVPNSARATHALGADLTYECTGTPNQYKVKLKFFRDCNGISAPSGAGIQIRYASNNVVYTNISLLKISVNDITPLCPGETSNCQGGTVDGVEEHTYEGVITLPTERFLLEWRLCCRNNVITNLSNPGGEALFVTSLLDNTLGGCNNSPSFGNQALAFGCVNEAVNYNHGASDADGDELLFSFTACLENFNNKVEYGAGFSATNPLTTASGTTINPNTGQISFTPTTEQVSVVCVKVEEFRNGVKIGEVTRDIQFDIENCGTASNRAPSAHNGADSNPKSGAIGVEVCMEVNASDPDGNNIWIARGTGIPSGTFTPSLPTEAAPVASYSGQFCWTPQVADVGTNFLTLRITDDACPTSRFTDFTLEFDVNCTAPTITCPLDQTGALDANCAFQLPDYSNLVTITGGDCGPYTVTQVPAANTTINGAGSVSITLGVTDGNGTMVENCNVNLTVTDQTAPTLNCQDATYALDNTGNFTLILGSIRQDIFTEETDNCGLDGRIVFPNSEDDSSFDCEDVGEQDVTFAIYDNAGNEARCTVTITITDPSSACNQPPVASCQSVTVDADADCQGTATAADFDGGSTDPDGDVLSFSVDMAGPYSLGETPVTLTVKDGNGGEDNCQTTITVNDVHPPVPDVTDLSAVNAECSVTLTAPTATDNCVGSVTATTTNPITYDQLGTYTVTWAYNDGKGNSTTQDQTVTVFDATAPVIGDISIPLDPAPLGTTASVSADFTDGCDQNDHTATWNWGDGTSSNGTIVQADNTVSGSHDYSEAGVYVVTLTVTDDSGNFDTKVSATYIVIYDPSGNFVTGGGWIDSPLGAYIADPSLTGHANFGFVSKYRNGANIPTGNTVFKFNAANFKFKSSSYEWLVVAGANAKFKGEGTVNNSGNYGFMVTGTDGDINGGGGVDKFRIKIWDKDNGDAVVYDNQIGADDTGYDAQELAGGKIQIHGNNGNGNGNGNLANANSLDVHTPGHLPTSETEFAPELELYPNPATSSVTVHFAALPSATRLVLLDIQGRKVWERAVAPGASQLTIDISATQFVPGVYTLSAIGEWGVQTRRLLIQR